MTLAHVEGDLEVDPDRLPRLGLAIRAEPEGDVLHIDGRRAGRVTRVADVRDYTARGGVCTYQRITYQPDEAR
jgi:hypothetical protein